MELEVGKLVESIGVSVSEAQQGLENHALQRFFHYFEAVGEDNAAQRRECNSFNIKNILKEDEKTPVMRPVTAKILIPCSDDLSKSAVAEIPLAALANHMQVHLDKVTVKVKTKLITDNSGSVKVDINAPVPNGMNSSDTFDDVTAESGMIEMVFHVGQMSEGESRVVQNIERVI